MYKADGNCQTLGGANTSYCCTDMLQKISLKGQILAFLWSRNKIVNLPYKYLLIILNIFIKMEISRK